jgi:hypothetical protein
VKTSKKNIIILLAIVFLLFFYFPLDTSAGDVNFSQAILPVRFVYLNKDNIEKIWNNAKALDNAYIVKFVSLDEKKEIKPTEKNFADYQDFVCWRNAEFGALKDNLNYLSKNNTDLVDFKIDFIRTSNRLEEIHTLV